MPRLAVVVPAEIDGSAPVQAMSLANSLGLPTLVATNEHEAARFDFLLRAAGTRLEVVMNRAGAPGPLVVDFDSPLLDFRASNDLYRQSLLRAAGVRRDRWPRILDATAGLGKDAYLLASAGCSVHMLEQNPVVHALLSNGLVRGAASLSADVRLALARMTLSLVSLADFSSSGEYFDVVYLDPMFPVRSKSARVKKDMWLLQQFFLDKSMVVDEGALLSQARALTRGRVVVKRPVRAGDFAGRKPTFRLAGRSSRYDVYELG